MNYLDKEHLEYFYQKLSSKFGTKEAIDSLIARIEKLESYHSALAISGKNIEYTPTETAVYNLYYANDNGILDDYDKICSFDATENTKVTYEDFNSLNVAPTSATRIVAIKENSTDILESIALTNSLKTYSNFGQKLYSVGLLSDIHIDGNGDENNSDSGNSTTDFQRALEYFNNTENVDFIAVCGDITYYGYLQDYQKFNELVSQYSPNTPVKTIRGNHECYENGESNQNNDNTQYQDNIGDLYYEYVNNSDVYLFIGMNAESKSNPFSAEEIEFLKQKLNTYRNQRVFLFVHYYYDEVGNINEISTHGAINDTGVTGKQFIKLIQHFKNVVYFSGHTHLDFRLQKYGKNANIKEREDICHRVHISSCSKPRISVDGTAGSAEIDADGSQGYVMDVYENGIMLRGIDFQLGNKLPIATYFLDTTPISIEEYVEESSTIIPVMEQGSISRSTGENEDNSSYIRTTDYIEVEENATYTITNTASVTIRVTLYDENKTFLTGWFTDNDGSTYSYRNISSGDKITIPANAKYMRFRCSTADLTTTVTIEKQ